MDSKMEKLIKALAEQVTESDLIASEQLARISATIAKCRIDMEMNQQEFAAYLGVSQGMVSKWESENYNFTIETLAKICSKLSLDLDIELKTKQIAEGRLMKKNEAEWKVLSILSGTLENGVA